MPAKKFLFAIITSIIITATFLSVKSSSLNPFKPLPSVWGLTPIMTAMPKVNNGGTLDILFIGNSYTFMHSMPEMIVNIAKSDKENPVQINIQSMTMPGARLIEHWEDGRAAKLLTEKSWHIVILQDQSNWALGSPSAIKAAHIYSERLKATAKQNGKPLVAFFKTWPKQKGSAWYLPPDRAYTKSHDFMRDQIDIQTTRLARQVGLAIIPVGDYWLYTIDNKIPIELYHPDGSHPSVAGSYLNALIFYRYFTASTLQNILYRPVGVDSKTAKIIKEIASYGTLK